MKFRTKIITSLTAVLAIGTSGIAMAKDHGRGPMHNEAAIAACQNQAEGTAVTFDHPMWGNVNAVCAKTPKGDKLVAMPPKMLEHMKQSQAACSGKAEGDKVAIDDMRNPGKKIEATCKKRGDVLAARLEHKGWGKQQSDKRTAPSPM